MTRKLVMLAALVVLLLPASSFARGPIVSAPQPASKGPIVSNPMYPPDDATNPLYEAATWLWELIVPQKPPKMN